MPGASASVHSDEGAKSQGDELIEKKDWIELTVNVQNLLVDVHLLGKASHHRVVQGQLAESVEHDRAVVRAKPEVICMADNSATSLCHVLLGGRSADMCSVPLSR